MREDNHLVMPSQYCSNCGYENKFTYKIPDICRACNESFIEKKSIAKVPRRQPSYQDDYEEDNYYEESSHIHRGRSNSSLKEIFSNAFRHKIGDSINISNSIGSLSSLVGTASPNEVNNIPRERSSLSKLAEYAKQNLQKNDGNEVNPE